MCRTARAPQACAGSTRRWPRAVEMVVRLAADVARVAEEEDRRDCLTREKGTSEGMDGIVEKCPWKEWLKLHRKE